MNSGQTRNYLDGSRVVAWLRRCRARGASAMAGIVRRLDTDRWIRGRMTTLRDAPLRAGGIIVIAAVLAHMGCVWVMQADVSALGHALRIMLLTIGFMGLFNTSDWQALKQGSAMIRSRTPR